jgi:hypothetical protein
MNSTRRTLALIGAPLLMLGFFLPAVSFLGLINLSYFDLLRVSSRFATGLIILLLGGISLFLALKSNFKPLLATGILALAVLAFDFITYKKVLAEMSPRGVSNANMGGGMGPQFGEFANQLASALIQPGWGMFIIFAGAILLIVAGAMKDKLPANVTDWNDNPPPPMNYS